MRFEDEIEILRVELKGTKDELLSIIVEMKKELEFLVEELQCIKDEKEVVVMFLELELEIVRGECGDLQYFLLKNELEIEKYRSNKERIILFEVCV